MKYYSKPKDWSTVYNANENNIASSPLKIETVVLDQIIQHEFNFYS